MIKIYIKKHGINKRIYGWIRQKKRNSMSPIYYLIIKVVNYKKKYIENVRIPLGKIMTEVKQSGLYYRINERNKRINLVQWDINEKEGPKNEKNLYDT